MLPSLCRATTILSINTGIQSRREILILCRGILMSASRANTPIQTESVFPSGRSRITPRKEQLECGRTSLMNVCKWKTTTTRKMEKCNCIKSNVCENMKKVTEWTREWEGMNEKMLIWKATCFSAAQLPVLFLAASSTLNLSTACY